MHRLSSSLAVGDDGLRQSSTVEHLIAEHLEPSEQGAEGILRSQCFHLSHLRCERERVCVACIDYPLASCKATSNTTRQEVARVDGEAIHHAEPAIAQHRLTVTGKSSIAQLGRLDERRSPRRHDNPASCLGNVSFIEHLAKAHEHIDDLNLARCRVAVDQRDRRSGRTKIDRRRDRAGGSAPVSRRCCLVDQPKEHQRIDGDLHLLAGIAGEQIHQVDIGLHLHDVVKDSVEVLALVNEQRHDAGARTLDNERLASFVVTNRDRGLGPDVDLVALVLDLALIVSVRDRREDSRGVELLDELARPDLRDERTGVGGRRC